MKRVPQSEFGDARLGRFPEIAVANHDEARHRQGGVDPPGGLDPHEGPLYRVEAEHSADHRRMEGQAQCPSRRLAIGKRFVGHAENR